MQKTCGRWAQDTGASWDNGREGHQGQLGASNSNTGVHPQSRPAQTLNPKTRSTRRESARAGRACEHCLACPSWPATPQLPKQRSAPAFIKCHREEWSASSMHSTSPPPSTPAAEVASGGPTCNGPSFPAPQHLVGSARAHVLIDRPAHPQRCAAMLALQERQAPCPAEQLQHPVHALRYGLPCGQSSCCDGAPVAVHLLRYGLRCGQPSCCDGALVAVHLLRLHCANPSDVRGFAGAGQRDAGPRACRSLRCPRGGAQRLRCPLHTCGGRLRWPLHTRGGRLHRLL
jgi:hypothetical protein